jgi:hypothetical protein
MLMLSGFSNNQVTQSVGGSLTPRTDDVRSLRRSVSSCIQWKSISVAYPGSDIDDSSRDRSRTLVEKTKNYMTMRRNSGTFSRSSAVKFFKPESKQDT